MSLREFHQWCVYRNEFGPLDTSSKICEYIKHLTFATVKIAGDKKLTIEDLELFIKRTKDDERPATEEEIIEMMKMLNNDIK
ncbi:hypothetical protein J7J47_03585 [Halomonas sp. ISL-60]|uniref:hypothetical protein n=1 Tax=Halomonas sp. ISL-56 TaxID=2819149 RepID=UPI001BED19B4|nr:hypothetical protein [Halomonas sp. ISL-56]MBT2771311.1 hypothetical protein [Halomonas sp. ISL-60]MBT2800668.1 hypothetical protein [Halomonas sp. ISL-56]